MGYREYLLKKLVYAAITLWAIATLNFFIYRLLGNPLQMIMARAPKHGYEAMIKRYKELWGLDKPVHVQYGIYIWRMLTWPFYVAFLGDYSAIGESTVLAFGRPIASMIAERVGWTFLLFGTASAITMTLGIILGLYAARRRGSLFDRGIIFSGLVGYSFASWWVGMVLIYIFAYLIPVLPPGGYHSVPPPKEPLDFALDVAYHMVLPVSSIVLVAFGGWALVVRNILIDVFTEDYILVARAKGLPERTIVFKHALRSAAPPIVTMVGLSVPFIFLGGVITETVFSWPGIGMLYWNAINARDFPILEALLYICALFFVLTMVLVDLIYGFLDPRIRVGARVGG